MEDLCRNQDARAQCTRNCKRWLLTPCHGTEGRWHRPQSIGMQQIQRARHPRFLTRSKLSVHRGKLIMSEISSWLFAVRKEQIVDQVVNDPRDKRIDGARLGVAIPWIFRHALGGGQANFDEPIGALSSRDRVMLYAFLLQKGHILELTYAFNRLFADRQQLSGATVLDVGCGPFTAGLALANSCGNEVAFHYFGVDTSQSMCTLGAELAAGAKDAGGLNTATRVEFFDSLDRVEPGQMQAGWTIVILSYLLASQSIDVTALVTQLVRACNRIGVGPVALLYTNSGRAEARVAFPQFRDLLVAEGFTLEIEAVETLTFAEKERSIHYALFKRIAAPKIPLRAFAK